MKITISETIEVDHKKWMTEFGVEEKDVRQDVKAYFGNWLQQHIEKLGLNPDNRWLFRSELSEDNNE